jgi:peptidoglycan/LPS O-acetylase OafA/YrhL
MRSPTDAVCRRLRSPSLGVASLCCVLWLSFQDVTPDKGLYALALFLAFVPVAGGNDWLGILSRPELRYVGAFSYSMYLTNMLVLSRIDLLWPQSWVGGLSWWAPIYIAGCLLLVCQFAALCFRYVELPFLPRSDGQTAAVKLS